MTALANRIGYGMVSGVTTLDDTRMTHSVSVIGGSIRNVTARAPKKSEQLQYSLEEEPNRSGYLLVTAKKRFGQKSLIDRTGPVVATYTLFVAIPRVERTKAVSIPSPKSPVADRVAPPRLSAKAFAMHMEHLQYLSRVSTGDHPPISPQTAILAQKAWQSIWIASDRMISVPAACTGADGKMFYSWDRGRHHLELEIAPGQDSEFFYRDRETGELWAEDHHIGDLLSSQAVAKLRFFI